MKLKTKYFGEIECEQEDLINFPVGLFGFDEEHQFVIMPFEGSGGTLLCLQSTVTPTLAFVVMDPFALKPDYEPRLQPSELKELGVEKEEELCFYVLCVVKHPVGDSTINLKCPVAINVHTAMARQIILETDEYDMRHLLSELGSKEEAAKC